MLYFQLTKQDFQKVANLLPELFPKIKIKLESIDINLVRLGLCESAPCIVGLEINEDEFEDILNTLVGIETDAFNSTLGEYPQENDPCYQRYLKYGCLYSIFNNAEVI